MRSTVSTVVSRVRLETGLPAPDFAELIGKPYGTLKSLKSGRLKLSETTALEISRKTGVALSWLLQGDPQTQPVDDQGQPWGREAFIRQQAKEIKSQFRSRKRAGKDEGIQTREVMKEKACILLGMFLNDAIQDPDRFAILLARTRQFLDALARESKK